MRIEWKKKTFKRNVLIRFDSMKNVGIFNCFLNNIWHDPRQINKIFSKIQTIFIHLRYKLKAKSWFHCKIKERFIFFNLTHHIFNKKKIRLFLYLARKIWKYYFDPKNSDQYLDRNKHNYWLIWFVVNILD